MLPCLGRDSHMSLDPHDLSSILVEAPCKSSQLISKLVNYYPHVPPPNDTVDRLFTVMCYKLSEGSKPSKVLFHVRAEREHDIPLAES